jgi:hypothetical protein
MGSIGDIFGDVIDTGADFLGSAGDVIGDVVGGIGDFAGDILENIDLADAAKAFIMSGGNPYAAAVAATGIDESLGFNPGSFMSGDFSSFGGGDFGGVGGGGFDLSVPDFGGLGDLGNFDISEVGSSFDLSNLGNLGQDLGDIVDYGDYAQLGDAYNTSTSVLDNLGDLRDYGDYAQLGQDVTQGNIDYANQALNDYYNAGDYEQLGQIVTPGNIEAGNKAIQDYLNNPISTPGIGDTIRGGLDTAVDWYKKYGKMAGDVAKLITSYQAGQLSKKQQEELNRKIQAEYDAYNAKKSGFASQIASGSLPQLNISRGTYSPVRKYNPVYAANGGAIRKKYGTGGITDIIASLTLPSMEDILSGYEKYGDPIAQLLKYGLSYGAGKLSKKQQEELNRIRQAQYDKYNSEKSAFADLIASGNLPSLNITRGTTPTVKMAMGGITNLRPRTSMGIMGVNR